VGESGRRVEGVRPAVVNRGGGRSSMVGARLRDKERERRSGRGWHGSGILRVLYIGQGNEVRGRGRKSGGRWWVLNTGRFEIEKERGETLGCRLMKGNRGGIGGALLPLPPSTGGHPMVVHGAAAPVGAVAARAFDRRKEKMERASTGPKGRSGPPEQLGLEREVGQTGPKWAGRRCAGEGGKMDQASREFGPKPIWAA
jgi:hypothetical protein